MSLTGRSTGTVQGTSSWRWFRCIRSRVRWRHRRRYDRADRPGRRDRICGQCRKSRCQTLRHAQFHGCRCTYTLNFLQKNPIYLQHRCESVFFRGRVKPDPLECWNFFSGGKVGSKSVFQRGGKFWGYVNRILIFFSGSPLVLILIWHFEMFFW